MGRTGNDDFADGGAGRVGGGASQFALREWRRQMSSGRAWSLMGVAAVGLAILDPFSLSRHLTPPGLAAYWFAVVSSNYAVGLMVHLRLEPALRPTWPLALRLGALGGATALAVLPLIVAANVTTFRFWPDLGALGVLALQVLALSVLVSTMFHILDGAAPDPAPEAARPALLDRLPPERRGAILSLSAQDHYTEVVTEAGTAFVLIRLSDAIREAEPTQGLRVHRSHWVARDAVRAARRDGDRAVLTLASGAEIPVSRANLADARAAGLLAPGGRR